MQARHMKYKQYCSFGFLSRFLVHIVINNRKIVYCIFQEYINQNWRVNLFWFIPLIAIASKMLLVDSRKTSLFLWSKVLTISRTFKHSIEMVIKNIKNSYFDFECEPWDTYHGSHCSETQCSNVNEKDQRCFSFFLLRKGNQVFSNMLYDLFFLWKCCLCVRCVCCRQTKCYKACFL